MTSVDLPVGLAHSDSWLGAQKNVVRIFDTKFRTSTPAREAAFPTAWLALSEAEAVRPKMYEDFVTYLKIDYLIESGRSKGDRLAVHSVMNYLGCLIQVAANRFKVTGGSEAKLFFTCQDPSSSTEAAQWLRKLKTSVQRDLFERAFTTGETMDKSAPALELSVLQEVNQAYSREGSEEVRAHAAHAAPCPAPRADDRLVPCFRCPPRLWHGIPVTLSRPRRRSRPTASLRCTLRPRWLGGRQRWHG